MTTTLDGIADYEFVRTIGEGSTGTYHLASPPARLPVDAEYVVVKVLSSGTTDETFRRATRELRVFASVQSPYLVQLFDAGQEGGKFYYAMEYHPLGSLAAPARPLDRSEVVRAVRHAALAADALHEAGCAHRDIKPSNILLHDDGAVLSGLGLTQILNPGQTITGLGGLASVEYIDPAILRGDRAARSSDIWSLGATLHRALAGTGIYGELPDRDPLLALRTVIKSTPQISPAIPEPEAAIVRACLDPDPARRPATGAELASRLEALGVGA